MENKMKKIVLLSFLISLSLPSFAQDSTTYYKILKNTMWFYIDLEDESGQDNYYVWSKQDLKNFAFDVLQKNGVTRSQKLYQRDKVGIRDVLLEIKIDTSSFLMSFDYIVNQSMLRKMRIINIELNIKKPVYFTGIDNLYLTNIGRKRLRPFIIQLPLDERSTMDQIIYGIEDLLYEFIKDHNCADKY
jgi:hypothetical protein